MKRIFSILSVLCALVFFVDPFAFSQTILDLTSNITVTDTLFVLANTLAPSYVPAQGWTPDRAEKWSRIYHIEHEQLKIFDETYTGVSWSRRGPSKNDVVTAAPIKVDTDLVDSGFVKRTEMDSPLFNDSVSRLNSGRLRKQKRTGHENTTSKRYLATPLALWFDSVKEEDSEIAQQEMATGDMVGRLNDQLTRHTAQYKDDEHLITLNAGYPQFVYRTIGMVQGLGDGATVTGDSGMAVYNPPTENPNTFVYGGGVISEAAYDANQTTHSTNILTEMNKVTATDKPSLAMLQKINTYVLQKKMVGVEIANTGKGRSYVIMLVSPKFMEVLKADSAFQTLYNKGFMGFGYDHPLIKDEDIKFENLIIRSEEKLLDPQWAASVSFNATGVAGGNAALGEATDTVFDVTGSGEDKEVAITWGTRTAGTDFAGSTDYSELTKFYLMGADSMVYVPGNPYAIGPRDTNDYGRITALGCKHIFGIHRTDWTNAAKEITLNQSSAVGYCWIG